METLDPNASTILRRKSQHIAEMLIWKPGDISPEIALAKLNKSAAHLNSLRDFVASKCQRGRRGDVAAGAGGAACVNM